MARSLYPYPSLDIKKNPTAGFSKKKKKLGSNFRMRSIFLSNIQRELDFYLDITEKKIF